MGRERWGGGNRKGETVKGQMGGGEEGARGEEIWQWGGGKREEEMEREAMGKEGKMGRGQQGGGKEVGMGRGRKRGKRRGDFTDGYDGMPGWT